MATIRKRGGRYHVQIRLKGSESETASFSHLTAAKEWASKTETDKRSGQHFGRNKRYTFNELADDYLEDASDELRSISHRVRQINQWRKVFGNKTLDAITPDQIKKECKRLLSEETQIFSTPATGDPKLDAKRERKTRTGATVNRSLAALSACFTYAMKEKEWIEKNPCRNVRRSKESKGRVRFLSDDERVRLLDVCRPHPDLYLALLLALTTGARQGELMTLHWDQVNFSKNTIYLPKTKNDDSRTLPLVGEARKLLWKRARAGVEGERTVQVFPATERAKKSKYIDLRTPWLEAMSEANILDFRWHDLRHTAASYLTMMGISHVELAKMLGQRTLSMVLRYSHLNTDHIVTTGEKLAERLGVDK
jgi:integrase